MKILIPVDGSQPSMRAVECLIEELALLKARPEIYLINVQHHVGGLVASFVSAEQIKQYREEEGMAALTPAMQRLDAAGVTYQYHIGVGSEAQVIVEHARATGCHRIIIAAHGAGGVGRVFLGSVATKVMQLSPIPVLLVK